MPRLRIRAPATIVLLLLPALALPQSLGEIARQEAERRKRLQTDGKAAPVVGDDALEKAGEQRRRIEAPRDDSAPAPTRAAPAAQPAGRAAARPPESSATARAGNDDIERERVQRERDETMWRERLAAANNQVAEARARYDAVKNESLAPGQRLVDAQGNVLVRSPAELESIIAAAKAELDAAEKVLEDLLEAARRAGVPPGWLR
jgi:hypothetical protein